MVRVVQASFSRGELAPGIAGRNDISPFYDGLKKASNAFVHQFGGVSNRPGQVFIAPTKDHSKQSLLVPFVFGSTDTHLLEFGDLYVRVFRNDNNVFEAAKTITGATQANPVVITTSGAHGYTTGDELLLSGVGGMTELNGKRVKVTVLTGTTFSIADQYTGLGVDGTSFAAFTSGGSASKVYEIVSPYSEEDLPLIVAQQSFDVVYLTCPGHPRRRLERSGLTSWQFALVDSAPDTSPPTGAGLTVTATASTTVRYAVTAVNSETDEESAAAPSSTTFAITAITQANPTVVTCGAGFASTLQTGHEVLLTGIAGMTELNNRRFTISRISTTQFSLQGVDSTAFAAYVSGGDVAPAFVYATNSQTGTSTNNTITWTASPDALRYSVYKEINGVFGFLGETQNTQYVDNGTLTPNTEDTLPITRDPFFGAGNSPSVVGEHQQRGVYAGTENGPARLDFSQIGAFDNFNRSIPSKANDAFSITVDTRGENAQVRHLVSSQRDLIVLMNSQIKSISSGDQPFSLANLKVRGEDRFGASRLTPLVVRKRVIFQEQNGERIHAGQFSFTADGFITEDLSLFSSHLFENASIVQWAFVTWPEQIIYAVFDDGTAAALTYNPEEQALVTAWCPWSTDGFYESVTAVQATAEDRVKSVYFIVKRVIDGRTVRLIEKLHSRRFDTAEDCVFLDSCLSYDLPLSIEAIANADPAVFTSAAHGLSDGDTVSISGCLWDWSVDDFGNPIIPTDASGIPDDLATPNGRRFIVDNATTNTFQLVHIDGVDAGQPLDGSDWETYLGGGVVRKVVTSLSGFEHLAGKTCVALVDGNVVRGVSIDAMGNVVFPAAQAFSRAHVGLPYITNVSTFPPELAGRGGLAGRMKTPSRVVLRLKESRGLFIGPDFSSKSLREWKQREYENYGSPTALFTGDVELQSEHDYKLDSSICIRQIDPLPFTMLLLVPEYVVS